MRVVKKETPLDLTNLLKIALSLVSTESNLDRYIIEGTLKGRTYQEIAEETYFSEEYVRARGCTIWEEYSIKLNKIINKKNFQEEIRQTYEESIF